MKINEQAPDSLRNSPGLVFPILIGLLVFPVAAPRADVPPPHISQFHPYPQDSVLLSWDATPESAYRVLTSSNLNDGTWEPVDYIVASSNTVTWQANGQSGAARFYRLATDGISIQNVEPSIVSTGVVVNLYIIGQGFGSNDVLRLIGPGGPLALTNRIIIKPTLMSVTVGPGFTPDLPGTYQFELTSGTTGQKATFSYAWTVVSAPAGSQSLLEPPREPPASPSDTKKDFKGHVTLMKLTDEEGESNARQKELTGHVTLIKFSEDEGSSAKKDFKGHVTLMKFNDDDEASSAKKDFKGHVTLMKFSDDEAARTLQVEPGDDSDGDLWPDATNFNARRVNRSKSNVSNNRTAGGGDCDDNDPCVQPWSGEVQLQSVDMAIPGRGLDFVWARTYRSRTTARPGMTYSWTCSYDVSVSQTSDGMAVFDGSGRSDVYYLGTNGVYSRDEMFNEGRLSNSVFTLTFPDTGRWMFNPLDGSATAGKLAQIVDRNGNSMALAYDSSGRLTQIVDDLGRTNHVGYNAAGQLASVTDFSGRTVTYQYYLSGEAGGSPGDLKSVTSPPVTGTPNGNDFPDGKTMTYTYSSGYPVSSDNENHLLLSVTDGKGQTLHQFVYQHNNSDLTFLRCISEQQGTNAPRYLTYIPLTANPSNNFATLKVVARDSFGNVSEASYDSRNRLVDLRQFTGRAPKPGAVTDVSNRPVGKLRSNDPDYYETQWAWNKDSLCVKEIEPAGNAVVCIYESDFDKNAGARKKGDLRVCRALACCADINRDGFPDLVTRYQYDPRFGSPARNYCVQYRESDFDFVALGLDPTTGAAYHAINTKGAGSNAGRLLPTVNKRTSNTEGTGTSADRLLPTVNKRSVRMTSGQPSIIENHKGFCISANDPNGNTTTGSYDGQGNLLRVTWTVDREPPTVSLAYNGFGQVTTITNAADANGRQRVDTASYYTNGPQTGYLRTFTVDAQGPTVMITSYEYDARGNITRCVDPRTNDWLYTYNALNQLVQSSSPALGGSGAMFRIATQYTYDAADNLTRIDQENRDYTGALGTDQFWRMQFVYDQQNRLSGCWRDKDGHVVLRCTELKYDGNDNLVLYRSGEAVNGNDTNKVVQFIYDERDRLYRCIAAPGTTVATTIQCDYDANGWPATKQYVDSGSSDLVGYTYDGFSRRSSSIDPMGNVVTNRYDANGNIILRAVFGETNDVPGSAGNVLLAQTTCLFDGLDRCVTVQRSHFSNAGSPVGDGNSMTTFTYAPNGQCLSLTDDNNHATRLTYDTAGRLSAVADPKTNTLSYAYDNNGNPTPVTQTDKSDLGGADQVFVTRVQYDALNRCVSVSDNTGNTNQYAYDSRNNLVRRIDPKGNLTGWFYDGLSRCTLSIGDLDGDGLLDFAADAAFSYSYDDNDHLLVATDDNTNSTAYAYDALDRLVMKTCADGTHDTFVWDSRGHLILSTDPNGTTVTNSYDLLDRCVRRDISPGPQVAATTTFEIFAYDGCSRLVQASNDLSRLDYAYDSLGNCTMRKQDCIATTYSYDGVGNCLSITYPGGRVLNYSYDALNQVSSVSSAAGGLPPVTLAQYQYEGPGRPGRIARANNINTRIFWNGLVSPPNAAGDLGWRQISRINHATAGGSPVIDQRLFAYDHNQNKNLRAQITPFVGAQKTLTNFWSHNPLNEMDHAINTKGTGTSGFTDYDFDAQGNRIAVTNTGGTGLYTRAATIPPADFQMDQYSSTPIGNELHDDNGNLTQFSSAAGQIAYTYDYADRLAVVYDLSTGSAVPVASFTYSALGQRLSKTAYPPSPLAPVTTYYVCGGGEKDEDCDGVCPILEERVGGTSGGISHVFCWGANRMGRPAVNTALASFTGAGVLEYYFQCDDLGSALALTDGAGNVLERYEYDDYGAPQFLTSDGVVTSATSSAFGNPFLFRGMQWDSESGLYCQKNSGVNPFYEDPKDGRYILRAGVPLRFGENDFTFAGNNPWSAANNGTTSKQGDFHLAHRFTVEIDGLVSGGGSEGGPTITDCDDNDPKRHHPTSSSSRVHFGFGVVVVSGGGDGAAKTKPVDNGGKKEYVGHVTLMK